MTESLARGRDIPWLNVVRFHKEIVARAEQGFFSLNGRDPQAERWTSLVDWEPDDMAGPWRLPSNAFVSQPFRLALDQRQHESCYLGGPGYIGWTQGADKKWVAHWRPIFFREVEVRTHEDYFELVPKEGTWSISPLLLQRIEQLEVSLTQSGDEFAAALIEKAATLKQQNRTLSTCILKALTSAVPELKADLAKQPDPGNFPVAPSPWVLFAPTTTFGAMTRHLMRDYERLEGLLSKDAANSGGLRLLEDRPFPEPGGPPPTLLPLVPLNPTQRQVVSGILSGRPLTVVSGPPGTGKSQVVVSLLLNAWASGKTVLFASNNNKAVDVVRERVERFESQVPIVIRAGSQKMQNIGDNLRRILALVSPAAKPAANADPTEVAKRKLKLERDRDRFGEWLNSGKPQRIDEARAAAFNGYANYTAAVARLKQAEEQLRQELQDLGFDRRDPTAAKEATVKTSRWLSDMPGAMGKVKEDADRKAALQADMTLHQRRRDDAAESVGLSASTVRTWEWLSTGPAPHAIRSWQAGLQQALTQPVEQVLAEAAWRAAFDRWKSAAEATDWTTRSESLAGRIERTLAEFGPKLDLVRTMRASFDTARRELESGGVTSLAEDASQPLRDWSGAFAELATSPASFFDSLPWSRRSRLNRQLRLFETRLRPAFPLTLWSKVGVMDFEGRTKFAAIAECAVNFLNQQENWRQLTGDRSSIDAAFLTLRADAAGLRIANIPQTQEKHEWRAIADASRNDAELATAAAQHWLAREERSRTEQQLRGIARDWQSLASGVPIWEAWRAVGGKHLDAAIRSLIDKPTPESVGRVRAVLFQGGVKELLDAWEVVATEERQASQLRTSIQAVPSPNDRRQDWWRSRPSGAFVLAESLEDRWPETADAVQAVDRAMRWCERWDEFVGQSKPAEMRVANGERDRALEKLNQVVSLLEAGKAKDEILQIQSIIATGPGSEWPLEQLNAILDRFNLQRIRARVEAIEAELERLTFESAKLAWVDRLRGDKASVRAIDALEKILAKNRNQVPESEYDTFRQALNGAFIWVTTAAAAQAIPLEPHLFDLVIIDEASQCTLTNLLPLVYRGKALAVIGDDHQLPAIPTIQEAEELTLARRYDVTTYQRLVGHVANDVYKAATESLPGRRGDVMMLTDHFRSHPQIIGFSNRHIYLQRLELKKDPSWGKRLPVGSGMHLRHVAGLAERGAGGRSWVNQVEAQAVMTLITELRAGGAKGLSLGVVTPFAAQKELLRTLLAEADLATEVLVDTAYGFQGDERDIMIFSPVVARGITPAASRWVETPPNLINVAITRARDALFLVGDVDYCCQQEGILRKLGLYCKDIKLLRDTSPAELELFSWMVVKGWEPAVHPRIGDLEVDFMLRGKNGARIVIEVDGRQHEGATEEDKARDAFLMAQNFRVLRVPARDVLETPFDVIHRIDFLMTAKS